VSDLRLAFNNLDFIPTSPDDVTKVLKPKMPLVSDVLAMKNSSSERTVFSKKNP
tara:strand:- start:1691 stop:1852 length:162 start_codon:yes stop_codon:yes gene_type:complete